MPNLRNARVKIRGRDIYYVTGGSGPALLVIHGGANGAAGWLNNVEELARDYTVYVPDMPGFGHSQPLPGDCSISNLAGFVSDFTRKLKLENFYLLGHSLGGAVALSYALKPQSRATKLVLVSSMCLGKEVALWVRVLSRSTFYRSLGTAFVYVLKWVKWSAEKVFRRREFLPPLSSASVSLGNSLFNLNEQSVVLADRLSEIRVPTLIVWGEKDPIVPAKQAYAAARLIPNCRVRVFASGGHSFYHHDVKEFNHLLRSFFGQRPMLPLPSR